MLKDPQSCRNHSRQFSSEHRARTWREFKTRREEASAPPSESTTRSLNGPRVFFFEILQPLLLAAVLDGVVNLGDFVCDAVVLLFVAVWEPLLHVWVLRLSATKLSVQGHRVKKVTK